jgi:glutathione S-transferase
MLRRPFPGFPRSLQMVGTMKLYYKAGACSLAPHIVLREAGETFEIEAVDLATKKTASGADFAALNPKGYIPALLLDDGSLLTEGAAISLYVAEKNPAAGLLPTDALGRARVTEMLLFIATELHKSFSPLFNPAYDAAAKETAKGLLTRRLDFTEKLLADGRDYLVGGSFTPADAYLFTVLGWTGYVGIDLASFANLSAFRARVAARPAVQAALKAEGLI